MSFFKDYFYFSKSERNGTIVLISIIIIEILLLKFSYLFIKNDVVDYSYFENEIDEFKKSKIKSNSIKLELDTVFYFNPNTIDSNDWKLLGLTTKQINVINNYLSKGGHFYKAEDFKKIYGISDKLYTKLKDYIKIEPQKNNKGKTKLFYFDPNTSTQKELKQLGFSKYNIRIIVKYRKKGGKFYQPKDLLKIYGIKKSFYNKIKDFIKIESQNFSTKKPIKSFSIIEINSADSNQLKEIKGIGSTFAKRILKYRKLLGGFYNKKQLMEVYGFDKEKLTEISKQIKIDTLIIKKININTASYKTILRHPYFNKNITSKLIDYRKFVKKINKPKELIKNNVLTKTEYIKLRPYIKF